MSWISEPSSLSEAGVDTMWDLYRRQKASGRLDEDYQVWCLRHGRDPDDAWSARAYEDWFVEHVLDDESLSYWRERGFGS